MLFKKYIAVAAAFMIAVGISESGGKKYWVQIFVG